MPRRSTFRAARSAHLCKRWWNVAAMWLSLYKSVLLSRMPAILRLCALPTATVTMQGFATECRRIGTVEDQRYLLKQGRVCPCSGYCCCCRCCCSYFRDRHCSCRAGMQRMHHQVALLFAVLGTGSTRSRSDVACCSMTYLRLIPALYHFK